MIMREDGRHELPDDTLHFGGSNGTVKWLTMTYHSAEEPKGCEVSVWELGNRLIMIKVMICFLIDIESTKPTPDGPNLRS